MEIDIASCIAELLYEHDSVIIPDLGGFMASYKPATIEPVQGNVHPPSKRLSFNENLVTNDGLLLEFVCDKYDISQKEGQEHISAFVQKTREALEKREMIVFPLVGRLYLDFENQFKFLQDTTNFNTDAYGLPVLQFHPVIRTNKEKTEANTVRTQSTATPVTSTKPEKPGLTDWLQRAMPFIVVLSLLIIIVSIYFIQKDLTGTQGAFPDRQTPPSERVNTGPLSDLEEEDRQDFQEDMSLDQLQDSVVAAPDPGESTADSEAPTVRPGLLEGVMIIGAYGSPENAEKAIQTVFEAGFDAYSDKKGNTTRVGVQFAYEDEDELRRYVREIRQAFGNSAWILRSGKPQE